MHVESELWRAHSAGRTVEPGEKVRVVEVEGLALTVAPEAAEAPKSIRPRRTARSAQPKSEGESEAAPTSTGSVG